MDRSCCVVIVVLVHLAFLSAAHWELDVADWHSGLVASSFIQLLVIAAFLFLSLVLVAYTPAVGWVAVAFTSIAAASAFVLLAIQWM